MKKQLLHLTASLLCISLFSACADKAPAETPAPASSAESTAEAQASAEPTMTAETPAEPEVIIEYDPKAYQDPDDNDYLNALVYATNPSDQVMELTIRCQVFDESGTLMSAYDQFTGKSIEKYTTYLYVPAGADKFPIGFTLPMGYRYDLSADKYMPTVGHLEFELQEVQPVASEDLRDHFTLTGLEEKSSHIYAYEKFDQEIADKYSTLYPSYTLLGYAGDEVVSVSCQNSYPMGTSSVSVSHARENTDSSVMVYRSVPNVPVERWELYLGCVGGE